MKSKRNIEKKKVVKKGPKKAVKNKPKKKVTKKPAEIPEELLEIPEETEAGNLVETQAVDLNEELEKEEKKKEKLERKRKVPVSQYAMNSKRIRTFPSLDDAVLAMEISHKTILDYINGKRYQTGGYMWGYDGEAL